MIWYWRNCSLWKCRNIIIHNFGMPFVTAEFVLLFRKWTLHFLYAVIVPKICNLLLVLFVCLPLLLAKKNSCITYLLNLFLWVSICRDISWCKCYEIWKKKKNEKLSRIHLHSLHDIFFPVGWTDADPWGCWEMTLIDGCCLRSQHTADSRNPTRVSSALWRAWSNKIIFLINLSSTSVAAMLGKINCLSVLSLSWICLCLFQLPREMHPCPSLYWKLEERF